MSFEGRGFVGARNVLATARPFFVPFFLEAEFDGQRNIAQIAVDGQPQGQRTALEPTVLADQITVGARYYENGDGPQRVQGFFHGDIAEILWFGERLTQAERTTVYAYLEKRYAQLRQLLPQLLQLEADRQQRELLVPVADPPVVQVLVPGFTVRELPVRLPNINNVRYRPDGKLVALGYNGNVWLLSDEDGDGLEEGVRLFFENRGSLRGPIGMALVPANHPIWQMPWAATHPKGTAVIVASKGKLSVIIDRDGDDRADHEQVIASGWQEIPQNIDACGVAIDPKDGSIFFGLGTAAYYNPYLLDSTGRSAYDLSSVRGTIQRISPDLRERRTVCTGVRFTIGMAFDRHGELFVTDQEGATWLANGNPFDELLHIRPGSHYGFPPRHPRHLPRVFDEPSLYDYGPQHQSTCGMVFNLPAANSSEIFGPDHWIQDVLVTGESRGKLYRTRLARDRFGQYVAANQLFACLGMLTVDVCGPKRRLGRGMSQWPA